MLCEAHQKSNDLLKHCTFNKDVQGLHSASNEKNSGYVLCVYACMYIYRDLYKE